MENYLTPEEIGMYKEYEHPDDFGLILNCAVRYAIGRMTYVPSSVINYITPLLPKLDDKTIECFIRDLEQQQVDVEKGIGSWGMECDRRDWLRFLDNCRHEKWSRDGAI